MTQETTKLDAGRSRRARRRCFFRSSRTQRHSSEHERIFRAFHATMFCSCWFVIAGHCFLPTRRAPRRAERSLDRDMQRPGGLVSGAALLDSAAGPAGACGVPRVCVKTPSDVRLAGANHWMAFPASIQGFRHPTRSGARDQRALACLASSLVPLAGTGWRGQHHFHARAHSSLGGGGEGVGLYSICSFSGARSGHATLGRPSCTFSSATEAVFTHAHACWIWSATASADDPRSGATTLPPTSYLFGLSMLLLSVTPKATASPVAAR